MDFTVILTIGGIILADLLLSGDNAILIALASRNLPKIQQKKAICWGIAGAVVLRIVFAFVAALLVTIPLLKALGGVALIWIAVKLLAGNEEKVAEHKAATSLRQAVRTIIIADGIMSLDNVLAVVAIADGHIGMVIFGVVISIPFVMLSSQWLLRMINRFPIVIYLGGAVLGYAAAGMVTGDSWLHGLFSGHEAVANGIIAIFVLLAGYLVKRCGISKKT